MDVTTTGTMAQAPDPLAPAMLGPVRMRNRIIKSATSEGRSPDGLVTDALIDFHLDVVRGGVGMTTVAYCRVTPEGAAAPGEILMSREALPGLQRMTRAIHDEGGAISAQLGHAGVVASKKVTGVTAVSPSKFINPSSFQYCREITHPEIQEVINQFGRAAEVAVEAGFDAVELHFGHLYLPSSFLSPLINRRKDEYGGSIENRSRLVREIAQRVREVVGDKIAVIGKLSMSDGLPGSIWLTESQRTVQLLDQDANLDAILLTQGSSVLRQMFLFRGEVPVTEMAARLPQPLKMGVLLFGKQALGSYPYEDMYMLESARQFTDVVKNTQLILLGGITNYEHFTTAMDEGFSFVSMARALLREPDLVNRIKADHTTKSRCNHNNKCMATVFGKAHCVLVPDEHYKPIGATGDTEFAVTRPEASPAALVAEQAQAEPLP